MTLGGAVLHSALGKCCGEFGVIQKAVYLNKHM